MSLKKIAISTILLIISNSLLSSEEKNLIKLCENAEYGDAAQIFVLATYHLLKLNPEDAYTWVTRFNIRVAQDTSCLMNSGTFDLYYSTLNLHMSAQFEKSIQGLERILPGNIKNHIIKQQFAWAQNIINELPDPAWIISMAERFGLSRKFKDNPFVNEKKYKEIRLKALQKLETKHCCEMGQQCLEKFNNKDCTI